MRWAAEGAPVEIEQQALEYIQRYVRYGFYQAVDVERIVGEDVFSGAIPRKQLRKMVKAEMVRQLAEQKSWPTVTDCDRLDRAFTSLESDGILALHNAGLTPSEGIDEVSERYHESGGTASGIVGYCFYHGQDIENALEHGELSVAFGEINGDSRKGVEMGKRVCSALEAAGLRVAWTGSIKDVVTIQGFRWQRRNKIA